MVNRDADSGVKHRTPKESIKQYCLRCVGGSFQDVKDCDADDPAYHVCPFHPYRLGKGRTSAKIIRMFCLDCMGVSPTDRGAKTVSTSGSSPPSALSAPPARTVWRPFSSASSSFPT